MLLCEKKLAVKQCIQCDPISLKKYVSVLPWPVKRVGGFKMGSKADGGGAMCAAEEGTSATTSEVGVNRWHQQTG